MCYGSRVAGEQDGRTLPRLVGIMQRLLGPGGCPWDREQTPQTLRPYVIEEAHEVVDAIDRGDDAELCEELGDLLLQVVFHAELARARGAFGPDDVVAAICEKLVRRHPHVFADVEVSGSDEVIANWEQIKKKEKAPGSSVLDGVPVALPALLRAMRMSEKAAAIGLDWPDPAGARRKVDEELGELDAAVASDGDAEAQHELGDVLFALANWGRKLGLDPESALRETLGRFDGRVRAVEQALRERGGPEPTAEELDDLWERAKRTGG